MENKTVSSLVHDSRNWSSRRCGGRAYNSLTKFRGSPSRCHSGTLIESDVLLEACQDAAQSGTVGSW